MAAGVPHPYPAPRVPVTPVLSGASLGGPRPGSFPSVLDGADVRQVTSGRIAIALAMREMRIAPGDEVLVPAWHSASMIPPVIACGAVPVFYRLRADASADLDDIGKRIGARTRAVVVVNYFGFAQARGALRALCDARGLLLLEDCAHSFFGSSEGAAVGSVGDYAIASSMKFFPIYEGGCLSSTRHRLATPATGSAGLGFELKSALAAVERGNAYGRLNAVRLLLSLPLALKGVAKRLLQRGQGGASGAAPPALTPSSSDSSYDFDPAWLDKRASMLSRAVMRLSSGKRIAGRRRANYLALQAALAGIPGWRPLFPTLPDGVVPWAFPVLLDDPAPAFDAMKHAGVPIVRFGEMLWEGVDERTCPVSAAMSRQVMGFVCHQELRADELAWMIGAIRSAA